MCTQEETEEEVKAMQRQDEGRNNQGIEVRDRLAPSLLCLERSVGTAAGERHARGHACMQGSPANHHAKTFASDKVIN